MLKRAIGDGSRCGFVSLYHYLVLATLYHTSNLNDRHTPVYKLQYSGAEFSKCFTREVSQLPLFVSFDSCKVSDVCIPLRLPQHDYELRFPDSGQIHRKPADNFLDEE